MRNITFLIALLYLISCKENISPIVKSDLDKFNLKGKVSSFIQYNNYNYQFIAIDPFRSSKESKIFDSKGYLVEEYQVDDQDSIIMKHFHKENYLLDSTIIKYINVGDLEFIGVGIQGIGVDDSMSIDYYNQIAREHTYLYYYDALARLRKKTGLNFFRDTIRIEKFEYSEEGHSTVQKIYFPKRDFRNKIVDSYNENNQLISKSFSNSTHYRYNYNEIGLLSGFEIYLSSSTDEPFQKIDSIKYKFDPHGNWIQQTTYSEGQIESNNFRKIKYN